MDGSAAVYTRILRVFFIYYSLVTTSAARVIRPKTITIRANGPRFHRHNSRSLTSELCFSLSKSVVLLRTFGREPGIPQGFVRCGQPCKMLIIFCQNV